MKLHRGQEIEARPRRMDHLEGQSFVGEVSALLCPDHPDLACEVGEFDPATGGPCSAVVELEAGQLVCWAGDGGDDLSPMGVCR